MNAVTQVIAAHQFESRSTSRGSTITHHAGCSCDPEIEFEWGDRESLHEAHLFVEIFKAGQVAGRRATLDPGAFVKRGPDYEGEPYGERLDQWQERAMVAAIAGEGS